MRLPCTAPLISNRLQGCLSSAVCEPPWLNPWQSGAQSDLQGWGSVLGAAEQLLSM
jgi:hypothetical protein